mmetsp:Transcript_3147/g.6558  ORF Transcript_3147/g.6558 Transcript_3147/m.6558 type:complete len:273 (+) Transcript_3147:405-1223(+)
MRRRSRQDDLRPAGGRMQARAPAAGADPAPAARRLVRGLVAFGLAQEGFRQKQGSREHLQRRLRRARHEFGTETAGLVRCVLRQHLPARTIGSAWQLLQGLDTAARRVCDSEPAPGSPVRARDHVVDPGVPATTAVELRRAGRSRPRGPARRLLGDRGAAVPAGGLRHHSAETLGRPVPGLLGVGAAARPSAAAYAGRPDAQARELDARSARGPAAAVDAGSAARHLRRQPASGLAPAGRLAAAAFGASPWCSGSFWRRRRRSPAPPARIEE